MCLLWLFGKCGLLRILMFYWCDMNVLSVVLVGIVFGIVYWLVVVYSSLSLKIVL